MFFFYYSFLREKEFCHQVSGGGSVFLIFEFHIFFLRSFCQICFDLDPKYWTLKIEHKTEPGHPRRVIHNPTYASYSVYKQVSSDIVHLKSFNSIFIVSQ